MAQLPVSRLIAVAVSLTIAGAKAQNLSTVLVLGSSNVIDVTERLRTYATLTEVGVDFSGNTPEYLAAQAYFAQKPQPKQLKIGRWAKTATSGLLRGAARSSAQQTLSTWTAVTAGSFKLTKNGAGAVNITGLNFSTATNLNQVASLITAGLTGATMVWNAAFQRFELTSATTGAGSSIAFLEAAGTGTDISAMLGMQTGQGGYAADGITAETALAAAQLFDDQFGQQWYPLVMPEAVDNEHTAVAGFIEGTNNKHLYGVTTQNAGALVAATTTDIASVLKALGYNRSVVQYSSTNAYAVMSLLGRNMVVDFTGNNTTITSMYKQEPGVVAEQLNSTQANALQGKNCNVFVAYENGTNIIQYGTVANGHFIDEITGSDSFAVTVQQRIYNQLYTSPTKIPQTEAGMQLLTTVVSAVCQQHVDNGFLAPGVWNSAGFGKLNEGDYLSKGYYVYSNPIDTQNPADRAARKAPLIQVAGKMAGAVHTVDIAVTFNQ